MIVSLTSSLSIGRSDDDIMICLTDHREVSQTYDLCILLFFFRILQKLGLRLDVKTMCCMDYGWIHYSTTETLKFSCMLCPSEYENRTIEFSIGSRRHSSQFTVVHTQVHTQHTAGTPSLGVYPQQFTCDTSYPPSIPTDPRVSTLPLGRAHD